MTFNRFRNWFILAASSVVLASSAVAAPVIKNVGFVHGAFPDGSGWNRIYSLPRERPSRTARAQPIRPPKNRTRSNAWPSMATGSTASAARPEGDRTLRVAHGGGAVGCCVEAVALN